VTEEINQKKRRYKMCNPLNNEEKIYEVIKHEHLDIPPLIWELIDHHLGNDLYIINLIAGSHVVGKDKNPIPVEQGEKIIKYCKEINLFFRKLKEVTNKAKTH
jgi:hypothetical protein